MDDLLNFYVNGKLIEYIKDFDLFRVSRYETNDVIDHFGSLKEAIMYCNNN